jgi:hypothetical protein
MENACSFPLLAFIFFVFLYLKKLPSCGVQWKTKRLRVVVSNRGDRHSFSCLTCNYREKIEIPFRQIIGDYFQHETRTIKGHPTYNAHFSVYMWCGRNPKKFTKICSIILASNSVRIAYNAEFIVPSMYYRRAVHSLNSIQSPKKIANYFANTERKRKCIFTSQTSIATVQDQYQTFITFLTPLRSHYF